MQIQGPSFPMFRDAAFVLLLLAGSLVVAARDPADAHGALAVGEPKDIVAGGFSWGGKVDAATSDAAQAKALEICRTVKGNAPDATRKLCKIVETFDHKCYAMAWDPKDGTPGVGWSVAARKDVAEAQALERCHTTGGDRASFCVVSHSECDTNP
jgi:dienelactone hydrolase